MKTSNKFSKAQRNMLRTIWLHIVERDVEYAYIECDSRGYKPFKTTTLKSLIKKGLVQLKNQSGYPLENIGAFLVKFDNDGLDIGYDLWEENGENHWED